MAKNIKRNMCFQIPYISPKIVTCRKNSTIRNNLNKYSTFHEIYLKISHIDRISRKKWLGNIIWNQSGWAVSSRFLFFLWETLFWERVSTQEDGWRIPFCMTFDYNNSYINLLAFSLLRIYSLLFIRVLTLV